MNKQFEKYLETLTQLGEVRKSIDKGQLRLSRLNNEIEKLEAAHAPEVMVDLIANEANSVSLAIYKLQLIENSLERKIIKFNIKSLKEN